MRSKLGMAVYFILCDCGVSAASFAFNNIVSEGWVTLALLLPRFSLMDSIIVCEGSWLTCCMTLLLHGF